MKLGFICLNVPGHLNPITALARQLQARNHEVVFLYSSGAAGLPFVSSPEKDHFNEHRPKVSQMQGEDSVRFSVRAVPAETETILKSLPAIVQANGVDALVIDTVQFYAELGAMRLGLPYVHVSAAMHFDFSGYTPLSLYGWPHQTTPGALARNREGVEKFAKILEESRAGIKTRADTVGLKIDWNDLSSTLSPLASITQVPRAFDFESSHWPSQFHHTGPFHDGKGREKVDFPWERLTGELLIYASMATANRSVSDTKRAATIAL
jgi:UDP:flavonoid glycosyltransferase YjiC (YdhE family)